MFKDVIGHEDIKQRLITSLRTGRISHAQLFAGETGYGSLALALAFAQYVFCTGDKMPAENALHVGKYRNTSIRICTLYFRLSGKQKARSVMNISTNGVVC